MPQTKRPASPSPAASSALHDDLLSCTVDAENPLHVEVASEGHFIGVQPRGNLLLSDSGRNDRNTGLGALAALSDQTLLETLLPFLCGRSLACLAGTNKAFYGFIYAADTELWRPLVMDMCGGYFAFQWWWRVTFAEEYKWRRAWQDKQDGTEPGSGRPRLPLRPAARHAPSRNPATSAQSMSAIDSHGVSSTANTSDSCNAASAVAMVSAAAPAAPASTLSDVYYPPPPADWPFAALAALYPTRPAPPVVLTDFYSDTLFQPWYCASAIMANREMWEHSEHNAERVDARTLTVEEFRERYERTSKPVVIENAVQQWPLWKENRWAMDALLANSTLEPMAFACGLVDIPLKAYNLYASRVLHDESPLYLFDRRFGERAPSLLDDYTVPKYFAEDFYQLPQKQQEQAQEQAQEQKAQTGDATSAAPYVRPSYRWWLVGPARSGSSFHKDPLYTNAWNGLAYGKKKWILYPPHLIPPGIKASSDHLQVAAPISVAEWYLNFYHETRVSAKSWKNKPDSINCDASVNGGSDAASDVVKYDHIRDFPRRCGSSSEYRPVEIVQRAGDLVFIPSQWWHTALNFEFSVAVTQNYLHESNYLDGVKFLGKIQQPALRDAVAAAVEATHPGLAARLDAERAAQRTKAAEAELKRAGARTVSTHVSAEMLQAFKRSKPSGAIAGAGEGAAAATPAKFSFGFAAPPQ